MLSIDEARALILDAVRPCGSEEVALDAALDRVLAADVVAAHDVQPFDNSAMDGFAVRSGPAGRTLRVAGESRAGRPHPGSVGDGEAVRISTGAAMPDGADAVLQVELVEERDGEVALGDDVAPGRNVRRAGEDVTAGTTVLRAGARVGPAELAVASSVGAATLRVARRPRVAIVSTGDELVAPGRPLGPGQIHESNAIALHALATRDGAAVTHTATAVPDDPEAVTATLREALDAADVLLVTGGVSVGPHDHVKPALTGLGVTERFWRVALRPGKPTWFGTRDDALVLGLPGNPVSAMVTFLLFARPALLALQGADPDPRRATAPLGAEVERQPSRDECIRVTLGPDGRVTPTGPQGSHVLTSMLGADALAVVPRGEGVLPVGAEVELLVI